MHEEKEHKENTTVNGIGVQYPKPIFLAIYARKHQDQESLLEDFEGNKQKAFRNKSFYEHLNKAFNMLDKYLKFNHAQLRERGTC